MLDLLLRVRGLVRNDQFLLGVVAVGIGLVVGAGVVGFLVLIDVVHALFYGAPESRLASAARDLPWWRVMLAPAIGGLLVGLWLRYVMPGGRPQGIAHIVEATAVSSARLDIRAGIGAFIASLLSIGAGAPVGREGPAVHFGASVCAWMAERLHLRRGLARTMLGCGAAAAVAASFNAPIAGALFAHEVVVGHYAMSAFAPVVVASVTATLISRAAFGDFPAFTLPDMHLASFWEFPAFAGVGILAAGLALAFMRAIFLGEDVARRWPIAMPWRPMLGGLLVGVLALPFPEILSVGYEITDRTLRGEVPLLLLCALVVAKILGSALALGFGGFAGGVFSPSLVIGALGGGAFGVLATMALPHLSSGSPAYALVGMGATAAAVLGAPISTVLIVFELTRDTALTVAVMVAVVVATTITQQVARCPSFFHWQLQRRGLFLGGGRDVGLLRELTVARVLRPDPPVVHTGASLAEVRRRLAEVPYGELFVIEPRDGTLFGTIMLADLSEEGFDPDLESLINAADVARRHPPVVTAADSLERALSTMQGHGEEHLAVIDHADTWRLVGCVHESDLLLEYNRQLLTVRAEERGDA